MTNFHIETYKELSVKELQTILKNICKEVQSIIFTDTWFDLSIDELYQTSDSIELYINELNSRSTAKITRKITNSASAYNKDIQFRIDMVSEEKQEARLIQESKQEQQEVSLIQELLNEDNNSEIHDDCFSIKEFYEGIVDNIYSEEVAVLEENLKEMHEYKEELQDFNKARYIKIHTKLVNRIHDLKRGYIHKKNISSIKQDSNKLRMLEYELQDRDYIYEIRQNTLYTTTRIKIGDWRKIQFILKNTVTDEGIQLPPTFTIDHDSIKAVIGFSNIKKQYVVWTKNIHTKSLIWGRYFYIENYPNWTHALEDAVKVFEEKHK